ncbi:hypothetical protein J6590_065493 [Homalodisca vitripennis]|nr:hypothetical protein J6590_065493 [Homalodisca vitripennis]
MCVCEGMSRPRPGKNKQRHQDCYESSSPGSSGSSSPVLATRRLAALRTGTNTSTAQSPSATRLMNGVRATRQLRPRVGSSGSGADSPRSLDTPRLRSGSALSSPLRSSRQGTSSPGEDISEDSGIRVNRGTYQSMYQDVINIKALLLRLSRVMQENEAENSHENSQKGYLHDVMKTQGYLHDAMKTRGISMMLPKPRGNSLIPPKPSGICLML